MVNKGFQPDDANSSMANSVLTDIPLLIQGIAASPVPLAHFLNRLPVSLAILQTDKRIRFINRSLQALTGFSQNEAQGIPCKHILRSNLCGYDCPLQDMTPKTEPVCKTGNIINKSREKIPVRITFSPLVQESGELAGWLESVEDLRSLETVSSQKMEAYSLGSLLGNSAQISHVFQMVPGIAQTDSSVLITGETGTGKDVLAEVLHQHSNRAKHPFVKVNCGALPETLLESELFGHTKGAFTGATENRPGRFRLAHNGTLFLTEIGDLPLPLQVKLLSFLDDQVVYPLGSAKGVQVDVRIVAATHQALQQMVEQGRFRQDLLFRLNVVRIDIPPLRKRDGDIQLLLDHFLQVYSQKFQKPISGISAEARDILLKYAYPGNVRELKNIVEYAVNICQEGAITRAHLPAYLRESGLPEKAEAGMAETMPPGRQFRPPVQREPEGSCDSWPELEKQMILDALYQARGRKQQAATILGWGRSTLWRKMKRYGIDS